MRPTNPIRRLAEACGLTSTRGLSRIWREEPFASLYGSVRAAAWVDDRRCLVLYALAQQSAAVPGAFAEVGVYRGGTARLIALTRPDRAVYLFDTFSGMPAVDPRRDLHSKGDFSDTSLDAVRRFVSAGNAVFRPGFFPNSAEGLESERFAFVHIDCDIYRSVRACCEWFYPRLSADGALVFDDYGQSSCPGARFAVDEFFASKPECPVLTANGQAIIMRLPY
ncbi:MAG: TylF/MycF/NovP-related O-methyltransferase [Terriglobales bacterium]